GGGGRAAAPSASRRCRPELLRAPSERLRPRPVRQKLRQTEGSDPPKPRDLGTLGNWPDAPGPRGAPGLRDSPSHIFPKELATRCRRASRLFLSPNQEPGIDPLDLAPEYPPGIEKVVSHRGFAATQDAGDLARVPIFHFAQDESGFLFTAQLGARLLEQTRETDFLRRPARLRSGCLLFGPNQMERGAMGLLAALGASQEVDRKVGRDSVEPGIEGVLLVVPIQLLPDAQKDQLGDVARVLPVA